MADFGPPAKLTEDDLYALLRNTFSPDWINGLLDDPSSKSIFAGAVAVVLRLQDALDNLFYEDPFILTAYGATRSTTTVRLERPSGAMVTITDERFIDQRGAMWRPIDDFVIPFSAVPQTVDVPVESERFGDWLNYSTPLTFRIFDDLPDPDLVVVAGEDPAINGHSPSLDAIGAEYGQPRNPGESDSDYAARIRFLQDQVSPKAIADGALWMLDRYDATRAIADLIALYDMRAVLEPFVDGAQPAQRNLLFSPLPVWFDAVEGGASPGTYTGPWLPFMSFFDDEVAWMRSEEEARAWFDVFIPTPDGTADENAAAVGGFADMLDRLRSGGVGGRVVVGEPVFFARHPPPGTLAQAGTWSNKDGINTDEALVEALEKFDADDSYAKSSSGDAAADPLEAGDLLFSILAADLPPAPDAVERIEVHARVRRRVLTGTDPDPEMRFIVKTSSAGAAERVGSTYVIDHDDWRWYIASFSLNPNSGAALAPGDVQGGTFSFGVANAGLGTTEEIDVSELYVRLILDYG